MKVDFRIKNLKKIKGKSFLRDFAVGFLVSLSFIVIVLTILLYYLNFKDYGFMVSTMALMYAVIISFLSIDSSINKSRFDELSRKLDYLIKLKSKETKKSK